MERQKLETFRPRTTSSKMTESQPTDDTKDEPKTSRVLGPWVRASPGFVLVPIVAYGLTEPCGASFLDVLSVGVGTAGAALIAGTILGFLFALPRTIDQGQKSGLLATNDNLDQVSDWLTKILVGLGLVELGRISDGMGDISASVAAGMGGGDAAQVIAAGLLIYGAIDGFLVSYLWTRTALSLHFMAAAKALAQSSAIDHVMVDTPPPQPPPGSDPPPPPSANPARP